MSSTPTTSLTVEAIYRYIEFWNSAQGDDQRDLGRRVFNPAVRYRAPLGQRDGVDALLALAADFGQNLSGLTMTARRDPDIHHDRARLEWRLLRDGALFAEGTDILTFDELGAVSDVATFLDRAPEGFDPDGHH